MSEKGKKRRFSGRNQAENRVFSDFFKIGRDMTGMERKTSIGVGKEDLGREISFFVYVFLSSHIPCVSKGKSKRNEEESLLLILFLLFAFAFYYFVILFLFLCLLSFMVSRT
jgi:hypothetical protein